MVSRLTVLGSCGAWPEPGRACSGLLVEHDGFRIVLDLGYGTATRLLDQLGSVSADGLGGVIITHRHPDHMADLHALFRARWFGRRGAAPIRVFATEGVRERLLSLEEPDDDLEAVDAVFDWRLLPTEPSQLGPFRLDSWSLPHFVPNVGVRLSSEAFSVAYTGDTGPDPALVELARDVDLFVAEASDRNQRAETPQATDSGRHLNAREAARAASAAGARSLLLTHFWPGNDREVTRANAAEEFDGEILLADEGLTVDLAPGGVVS